MHCFTFLSSLALVAALVLALAAAFFSDLCWASFITLFLQAEKAPITSESTHGTCFRVWHLKYGVQAFCG